MTLIAVLNGDYLTFIIKDVIEKKDLN